MSVNTFSYAIESVGDEDDRMIEIVITIGKTKLTSFNGYLGDIDENKITFVAVNGVESELSIECKGNVIQTYVTGDWGSIEATYDVTEEVVDKFLDCLRHIEKLISV
jgi:uncharacterized protein (UPF0333 family)